MVWNCSDYSPAQFDSALFDSFWRQSNPFFNMLVQISLATWALSFSWFIVLIQKRALLSASLLSSTLLTSLFLCSAPPLLWSYKVTEQDLCRSVWVNPVFFGPWCPPQVNTWSLRSAGLYSALCSGWAWEQRPAHARAHVLSVCTCCTLFHFRQTNENIRKVAVFT